MRDSGIVCSGILNPPASSACFSIESAGPYAVGRMEINRKSTRILMLLVVGCGSAPNTTPDAPTGVDGVTGPDGTPRPDARCQDTVILTGGSDPAAQGRIVQQTGFAELTFPDNQTTQLFTDSGGPSAGGTLVLRRDGAVTPGQAFIIE